ncbi:hypothetical protein MAH1_26500 [Sessilibacter sp. MAH1]
MKLQKPDDSFMLGLCLFIRKVHLSIHRAQYEDWESLTAYLNADSYINKILGMIESKHDFQENDLDTKIITREELVHRGFLNKLGGCAVLTRKEIVYIYLKLENLRNLLMQKSSPSRNELIKIRVDFSYVELMLRAKLRKKYLTKIDYIEHFNQNPSLHCSSIEDLAGAEWLEKY